MLKSSLCDYCDAYILICEAMTVPNTAAAEAAANNAKHIIIKNCAPFTNCISQINNTQIGCIYYCIGEINNTQLSNAKDIDMVMPMYNLIEYSGNYCKASQHR